MAAKNSQLLGKLRTYAKDLDLGKYMSTEMRQNLKTLEYWYNAFTDFQTEVEPEVPLVVVKMTIGTSGTPILTSAKSTNVVSISRISAGRYLITTNKAFTDVNFVSKYIQFAAGSPSSLEMLVREFNTAQKTITVEFLNNSYAANDIAQDAIVGIKIYLSTEV